MEPTDDDTRGTLYCPLSADHRCALTGSVETREWFAARSGKEGAYPKATPCISVHNLQVIR